MSEPKPETEDLATPGTVMAAEIRARANKLTMSQRKSLIVSEEQWLEWEVLLAFEPRKD